LYQDFHQVAFILSRASIIVGGIAFAGGDFAQLAEQTVGDRLAANDGFGFFGMNDG